MKQQLFSLNDPAYFTIIAHTLSHLYERGINAVVVGGLAVQAHLLKMATDAGMAVPQDLLRKTDDMDLIVPPSVSKEQILSAMETLPPLRTVSAGETVFDMNLFRLGGCRSILEISYVDSKTSGREEISVSFSRNPEDDISNTPEAFLSQINTAIEIRRRHFDSEMELKMKVIQLENLIVSKLGRGRNKDDSDSLEILKMVLRTGTQISPELLEKCLRTSRKPLDDIRLKYRNFLATAKEAQHARGQLSLLRV